MSYDAGKIEATIDLDRSPFERSLDEAEQRARRFADQRYSPRIELDTAEIDRKFQEITERLNRLGSDAEHPSINLDTTGADEALDRIKVKLDDLDRRVIRPRVEIDDAGFSARAIDIIERLDRIDRFRATPSVDLNGIAQASAQLQLLQAQLNHINGQSATANIGTNRAGIAGLSGISSTLGSITSAFGSATRAATIFSLAVAAIGVASPVLAGLVGGVGILGGALVAAGAGVGLFALAVKTELGPVADSYKKLTSLQKQYNTATTDAQRSAALQKEKALLASLDPQQRALLTSVLGLKQAWKGVADSVRPQIFDIATNGVNTLKAALPLLQPVLKGAAGALDTLSQHALTAVKGPAFKQFTQFLSREAPGAILTFGHVLGDMGSTVGHVFEAFEPLIKPAEKAMTDFFDKVRDKSANLTKSSGFQNFLGFLKQTAPEIGQALGSLGRAFLDLLKSLEPLAKPLLGFVTDVGHAISTLTKSSGFQAFVKNLGDIFSQLGGILTTNAKGIGDFLGAFSQAAGDLLRALAPLVPHLITFITNIARFIDKIVSSPGFASLVKAIGGALDAVGGAINSIPPGLISGIASALATLVNALSAIARFGNGAGLVGLLLVWRALRSAPSLPGGGGPGGVGGTSALQRLIVPVAVTYVAAKAVGEDRALGDILNGDFAKAFSTDQPKWVQAVDNFLAGPVTGSISSNVLDAINFLKTNQVQDVIKKYGQNAGVLFANALANEHGNVAKAWNDVYGSIKGADPNLFHTAGQTAGDLFNFGLGAAKPGATTAGAGVAAAAGTALGRLTPDAKDKGTKGAAAFVGGIAGKAGGAGAAGAGLSAAATKGAGLFNGGPQGKRGANLFNQGVFSQGGGAAAAGAGLASGATRGAGLFNAKPQGSRGANLFNQGVFGAGGGAAAAGANLAGQAAGHSWWNGAPQGSRGGGLFAGGIRGQTGNAASAGASLAGGAASGAHVNLFGAGAAAGQTWAAGVASAAGAAAAAASAIAAAARSALPSSPAKIGPFSSPNDPESLGSRLSKLYAKGMRARIGEVGDAAQEMALAARISGQPASPSGAYATSGGTVVTGRSTVQHFHGVGPDVKAAVDEANRQRDFLLGA